MADTKKKDEDERETVAVTLPGTVQKVIPANSIEPEKAEIAVDGADDLYREIRVENALKDPKGGPVSLKKGAEVEVTIEASTSATVPKKT